MELDTEGILISPPGDAAAEGKRACESEPCWPSGKITIHAGVPPQKPKSVRLLPTQSLSVFLEKLRQKKILGDLCDAISCVHESSTTGETRQFTPEQYETSIWDLGVRDQVGATSLSPLSRECL